MSSKQTNVGILAIEVYTPRVYLTQSELEQHSGVASGKYTIGLGQECIGLVSGDVEDINSICLTVVNNLLEKYAIDPNEIGRLEVGTETLIDKSKSTKTVLMELFKTTTDIEGATIVNACYGGTAAFLNAISWCNDPENSNKKYAIVVAGDIAAYEQGAARPTSGCGAVAILVGADAPLAYRGPRATHATHVYDFYKPDHSVEYPVVDGGLSQVCYYQALEDVYERFVRKQQNDSFTAETPDYWVFHAPYNKLVQKSYGRLFLLDARRKHQRDCEEKKEADTPDGILAEWLTKPIEATYADRNLDGVLKQLSKESFQKRLGDANSASKLVGNTYTASVFLGLASLIDRVDLSTPGKSIGVFSYGSGALATMYRLETRQPTGQSKFTAKAMADAMQLSKRLSEQRWKISAAELDLALETRARMHCSTPPYTPVYGTDHLFPGTYYLKSMDEKWRRSYARVPLDAIPSQSPTVAPPRARDMAIPGRFHAAGTRIACVITGTSAGLPGSPNVFASDNLEKLVTGFQCIAPVSERDIDAMLEKNVVHTRKINATTTERIEVDSPDKCIRLAAQLGDFDLSKSYGVPEGLAKTMDVAAQVAVAAGMEALKDAGLVSGRSNDPAEWMLPEQYRDSTGVVYASSFPAMDAAVGEVMRFLKSKTVEATASAQLLLALRARMQDHLTEDDEAAFSRLQAIAEVKNGHKTELSKYEFDRKFLFRVLVLGNSQLAQLAGCRGPNTQTNAACAGSTQAIALAQDLLIAGRAERVVVVAGDNASGSTLLPWLGSGFRALGAATTAEAVEDAALPFDKRRSGLLLGAGGIAMVLETEKSQAARASCGPVKIKARLLSTQYSNSAFHGAALDRKHIGSELKRFLDDVAKMHGISKADIAEHGVYFSHETCTHASDASSCAGNEVAALRIAFGDELLSKLLILNTKGFTGHPMGVSFEDVTAVEVLLRQTTPAVPNYGVKDDYLGDLNISKGGPYQCRYALRFAAGFGSQVAFALYAAAHVE